MRLLLDTHVVIAIARGSLRDAYPRFAALMHDPQHSLSVSVASLWEIAIKSRLGKLDVRILPRDVPGLLDQSQIAMLTIDHVHATADLAVEPPTRDPFDRLLLAQCQVEAMRLVTVDRALADHPLAWRDG